MLLAGLRVPAGEQTPLVAQVNQAVMHQRRRHVGRTPWQAPLLALAARCQQPAGVRLDADYRAIFCRRHDDQVRRRDRPRYVAHVGVVAVLWVQPTEAPDLLAALQSMRDGVVGAVRDQVLLLALVPQYRRGVGMLALDPGVALALHLPDVLAGSLVEGNHPGPAGVHQRQVEPVTVEQRRRVHPVPGLKPAVAILSVEGPDFLAVEVEAGEVTVAGVGIDVLAVRAG